MPLNKQKLILVCEYYEWENKIGDSENDAANSLLPVQPKYTLTFLLHSGSVIQLISHRIFFSFLFMDNVMKCFKTPSLHVDR